MPARLLTALESAFERLLPGPTGTPGVEGYLGYATPEHLVVRGRVLVLRERADRGTDRWSNLLDMAALFNTQDMAAVAVEAEGVRGASDEEGYFTLHLPRDGRGMWGSGRVEVEVRLPEHGVAARCPVLGTQGAPRALVSDIDDTLIRTEAWSLRRNLWNSLLGDASTREVFADGAEMLGAFSGPVFYVSSSPWNLYGFLRSVFARAGLPDGPMFLRDLGLGPDQLVTPRSGHHGHKGDSIDAVVAAHPGTVFTLLGDTGQHDAQVYLATVQRHGRAEDGGRIERVILRVAEPVLGADDHAALEALRATGVRVERVRGYAGITL